MPDIILQPILETDEELQLFTPSDPYRYDVDNRPLRRLLINDQRLQDALSTVVTWLNDARGEHDTLAERLDSIQAQIDAAAGPAYLIGDNSEPFTFDGTNNVLRVKVDDAADFQVITFPTGTLTAAEVADFINNNSTGIQAEVASANRIKIASQTVGTNSRIEVDSVANGSTANTVLGFNLAGEASDFSTLDVRVSNIEAELIAARFDKPSLADFLSVSLNPDGTIKDGAIAFTATALRNLILSGAVRQVEASNILNATAINLYWDTDGGVWATSSDVLSTSWYNEPAGPDRGSNKNFPTYGFVATYSNRVEIFDLTDTTSPELWMGISSVFLWESGISYGVGDKVAKLDSTSGVRFYRCILAHTSDSTNEPGSGTDWETYWVDVTATEGTAVFGKIKKASYYSGVLAIATEDAGVFLVNFKKDSIEWVSSQGKRTYVGAIAQRNTLGVYDILTYDYRLPSNTVTDISVAEVDDVFYTAVSTSNGVALFSKTRSYAITASAGSSSTACALSDRYLAFSMGPAGSESRVYVIRDITKVASDLNADSDADIFFDGTSVPAFDTYSTTTLSVVATPYGKAIVRGSSQGVKILYDKGTRNESWVQYFSATRDTSLLMKGDVRGCWVMDKTVAPDEPLDDLSFRQNHLVAKGSTFTPQADGGIHFFTFDGTSQYLMHSVSVDAFSFAGSPFAITFMMKTLEDRNCTLIAKWDESLPGREFRVYIEGGKLKVMIYDETNGGYIGRECALANFELDTPYLIQIGYDNSGSPGGITFSVNGSPANGATFASGIFSTIRVTGASLTVGAHTKSDGAVGNFYRGYIGLLMINAEAPDDTWWDRVRRQVSRWFFVPSTRLHGNTNRVVSASDSPVAPITYVGVSDGAGNGAVNRLSLDSAVVVGEWSTATSPSDDLGATWNNNNILSVGSFGSLRVFSYENYLWYELDEIDLRRACTFLGDFSIDGTSLAYQRAGVLGAVGGTYGTGIRTAVVTITATDVTNGYITLPHVPSSASKVAANVAGGGVLVNAMSEGAVDPDFAVVDDKVIFVNGVTIGDYTSSGLSELLGEGDTLVFIIG